jgi:hypothetical protein
MLIHNIPMKIPMRMLSIGKPGNGGGGGIVEGVNSNVQVACW